MVRFNLSIRPGVVRMGDEEALTMKQYLISIYQPDGPAPDAEFLAPIMAELQQIQRDLRESDSWVFSAGLHAPDTATVVRAKGGDAMITDGPFVEGKEHLGGFTVIKATDLDEALAWGRRFAEATTLPIEVRPLVD
jgi:hypothetical protein